MTPELSEKLVEAAWLCMDERMKKPLPDRCGVSLADGRLTVRFRVSCDIPDGRFHEKMTPMQRLEEMHAVIYEMLCDVCKPDAAKPEREKDKPDWEAKRAEWKKGTSNCPACDYSWVYLSNEELKMTPLICSGASQRLTCPECKRRFGAIWVDHQGWTNVQEVPKETDN